MSRVLDPIGPAPETRSPRFLWLLFGCSAAPLFWLGQMILGYGVTAYVCYPGDHPLGPSVAGGLVGVLVAFDLIALAGCAAGALVSWRIWNQHHADEGRNRFLALWGVMSSLWFFAAILFNVFVSVTVTPCLS
jgi:hypothetical protein